MNGRMICSVETPPTRAVKGSRPAPPKSSAMDVFGVEYEDDGSEPIGFDLALSGRYVAAYSFIRGHLWWEVMPDPLLRPLSPLIGHPDEGLHPVEPDTMTWSPDERWLVGSSQADEAGLWRMPEGVITWRKPGCTAMNARWAPDSRTLSLQGTPAPVKGGAKVAQTRSSETSWWTLILDTVTGEEIRRIPDTEVLAWSPDGTRLVAVSTDDRGKSRVRVEDTRTWKRLLEVVDYEENAGEAAWSPDGKMIALGRSYNVGNPGVFAWLVQADTGKVSQTLRNSDGATDAICWSPDSRFVLFQESSFASSNGESRIGVYEAKSGRLVAYLVRPSFLPISAVRQIRWPSDAAGPLALVTHGPGLQVWQWDDLQKRLAGSVPAGRRAGD